MLILRVLHNGIELAKFENQTSDLKALKFIQSKQSHSFSHAVKYEGWDIETTDTETKEVTKHSTELRKTVLFQKFT